MWMMFIGIGWAAGVRAPSGDEEGVGCTVGSAFDDAAALHAAGAHPDAVWQAVLRAHHCAPGSGDSPFAAWGLRDVLDARIARRAPMEQAHDWLALWRLAHGLSGDEIVWHASALALEFHAASRLEGLLVHLPERSRRTVVAQARRLARSGPAPDLSGEVATLREQVSRSPFREAPLPAALCALPYAAAVDALTDALALDDRAARDARILEVAASPPGWFANQVPSFCSGSMLARITLDQLLARDELIQRVDAWTAPISAR